MKFNPISPCSAWPVYPDGGGEGTWVNFCWVCAAGFSEPLSNFSKIQLVGQKYRD